MSTGAPHRPGGREADAAVRTMWEAMRVARYLEGRVASAAKPDASPVTIADLAIQALVAARLEAACPDDGLMAEEDAGWLRADAGVCAQVVEVVRRAIEQAEPDSVLAWLERRVSRPSRRFWVLDPIDGTKGFLHGRQYAIALALIVDGTVRISVVGCPRLSLPHADDAFTTARASGGIAMAARGGGAWWRDSGGESWRRLEVSARGDVSTARVLQSFDPRHGDPARFARVLGSLAIGRPPVLLDSQVKQVAVAAGAGDLLMRFPPRADFHDALWDQAAGSLLVEEAGGRVTDVTGQPLDFTTGRTLRRNSGVLASNGRLHAAALEAIQAARPDDRIGAN